MKKSLPKAITHDDFSDVWNITDSKYCFARKKWLSCIAASFFSNLTFLLLCLILGNGLILMHTNSAYSGFLRAVPYFLPIWERLSDFLLNPDAAWHTHVMVSLLFAYAAAFVVCAVMVLIVTLLYHPFPRKLPKNTISENARLLLARARKARNCARQTQVTASALFTVLSLAAILALFTGFAFYLNDSKAVFAMLTGFLTSNAILNVILLFIPAYLAISVLYTLLAMLTRFLFRCHIPYSFVAQIECYTLSITESNDDKSMASPAAMRAKALELERAKTYGKARELLLKAAHGGDAAAMEHYARHCILEKRKEAAVYWLERCVQTSDASRSATQLLHDLKWHRKVKVSYLTSPPKPKKGSHGSTP